MKNERRRDPSREKNERLSVFSIADILSEQFHGLAERVGFEPTVARSYTRSPGAPDRPLQHLSSTENPYDNRCAETMAERVGFEPTLRLRTDRFSRAAP